VARAIASGCKSKDDFFISCAQGHTKLSQEIYRQIESFAGYSFCKAHSASCRELSEFVLKVYYPIEFMVAVINNQGGFIEPKCMCKNVWSTILQMLVLTK
jgi:DNA polymerase-3 subunit alpha/error-prone DNA polymerase